MKTIYWARVIFKGQENTCRYLQNSNLNELQEYVRDYEKLDWAVTGWGKLISVGLDHEEA